MPYTDVNSHALHYFDSHPDGAPPNGHTFILIHGLGSTQNFYTAITPFLTRDHRCIAFDTYGASRSPYTGQPISIASIASDAVALMDRFAIDRAVVVGHSMGGLVVSLLGAQYPDRVLGVVAIGPTYPSQVLSDRMRERAQTVAKSGMEAMANSVPAAATGPNASNLAKAFIRETLLNQNPEAYMALCLAIAYAPEIDYAAIKAPFLLIAGQEDKSASLEGCEKAYGLVLSANKRMEVLRDVGHWHCFEAPEHVGMVIEDFVGRTDF